MKSRNKHFFIAYALFALSSVIHTNAAAVEIRVEQSGIVFSDAVNTISISGSNGYSFTYDAPNGTFFIGLDEAEIWADGQYFFEIATIVYNGTETINDPANGRENVTRRIVVSSEKKSGTFRVVNGSVVNGKQLEEVLR